MSFVREFHFNHVSEKYWSNKTDGGHRYSTEEWLEKYASELLAMLPHGGTILDVGCGACELTTYIAPEFRRVCAVDASHSMLAAARKRIKGHDIKNIELLDGTAQALPREIERVDVVLSYELIQYFTLSDLDAYLRECHRVLNGSGVVCVANIPNAEMKRIYYRNTLLPGPSRHLAASLRRELHLVHRRASAYVKKDPFWDGIGNWFSRAEIKTAAERFGFNCELRNSWYYDYRFHALLSLKSDGLSASE
jgi:cyclopropane-fatty-acyl-phospholipid synthase